MSELNVVYRENVQAFDRLTLNTNHRLEFDDGELSAVHPSQADTTEYIVAVFSVEDGGVELPPNSAVLEATDTVVALVPSDAYGAGGSE